MQFGSCKQQLNALKKCLRSNNEQKKKLKTATVSHKCDKFQSNNQFSEIYLHFVQQIWRF